MAMKILWHSNAPWAATGYGKQTNLFVWRLKKLGHEMIVSAFYGLNGAILEMGGVKILPASKDGYGNDILMAHRQFHRVDIIIGLLDIWVLKPELIQSLDCFYGWTPVDHEPIPPAVLNNIKKSAGVIVFSQYAVDELARNGVSCHYVPHGVDDEMYVLRDRKEMRRKLGLPEDYFIAGMVAANKGMPSRKAFDEQITAFGRFHQRHPKSLLYLHTDLQGFQGEDLLRLVELAGLSHNDVVLCPQYQYVAGMFNEDHMSYVYNTLDVLLNASRGEGFGIPIIEAQFCGTPVIVTDYTAMRYLCYTGWKVPVVGKIVTPQGAYMAVPSIDGIDQALEQAFTAQFDRQEIRSQVLDFSVDNVVAKYWQPVLEKIEAERKVKQQELAPIVIMGKKANDGQS